MLAGTIRYFKDEAHDLAATWMQAICDGLALAHGIELTCVLRNVFDVLIKDEDPSILPVGASIMARVVEGRLALA